MYTGRQYEEAYNKRVCSFKYNQKRVTPMKEKSVLAPIGHDFRNHDGKKSNAYSKPVLEILQLRKRLSVESVVRISTLSSARK